MIGQRKIWAAGLSALVALAACSAPGGQERAAAPDRGPAEARVALETVAAKLAETAFQFDGEVHWQSNGGGSQPAALFRGSASPEAFYVRLSVTPEDGGFADDMEFFARRDQVFLRFADEVDWHPAEADRAATLQELAHWDPRAHFRRMAHLAGKIEWGSPERFTAPVEGETAFLQVVLDPTAMRAELAEKASRRAPETPDGDAAVERLSAGSRVDDRSVDGDEALSGTYLIAYDRATGLPKRVEYVERAVYTEDGQRNDDTTRVVFTFRRFGTFTPPDLTGIPGAPAGR
ncbi:MAG: hypothetical protein KM312_04880 [Hydrogenibacillus schlegelii]|uniref:Outer membrane lipoprotein-sorting protein n=1 Tax=Hydrogenibacillus schlegelii TaxID=1484 RepID=A0A947G7W8_HYDSH|nr:hypothetical protein [Hydrogenibacillus schlegelii]